MGINGGLGAHRYPVVGSGDTEAYWATASYQMYMNICKGKPRNHLDPRPWWLLWPGAVLTVSPE